MSYVLYTCEGGIGNTHTRALLQLEPDSSNWTNNKCVYSGYCPHMCIIISLLQLCGCIKYTNDYAWLLYLWCNCCNCDVMQASEEKSSSFLNFNWFWAGCGYVGGQYHDLYVLYCHVGVFDMPMQCSTTHINLFIIHGNWTVQYKYYFNIYIIVSVYLYYSYHTSIL